MAEEKKEPEKSGQEDDFTFGELKTGKEEGSEGSEGNDDDEKKEPEKKEPEKKEPEKKEPVKKEKEGEGKKEGNEGSEEDDDDADIFLDKEAQAAGDDKKISLKKLGKDLGVDLEKDDDEEEFKTKLSERLEKSKQEFNLDGYSEEAKAVIKFVNENNGDINAFFNNKQIISMQSVLALDPETKFRNVRIQEIVATGKTRAEAATAVDAEIKEMSKGELKTFADDIDAQAQTIIQDEVKKIVGDQQIKATATKAQAEAKAAAERTKLKTFIEKQDNFLGLGLTPEAKKLILKDIDNGNFDKVIAQDPESIKFSSYMFSKYGAKIVKKIESSLSEQNRKGYNSATKKHLDALHKGDDGGKGSSKKSGHEGSNKGGNDTGNKPKWDANDIDG